MGCYKALGILFAMGAISSSVYAGTIDTFPPSLALGDTYRLVFVTSATTDATSSDIGTYNAFVQDLANAVPQLSALSATWTAIVSTLAVNAVDNISWLPASDEIYGLDGTLVSGPSSLLFYDSNDGFFAAPIPTDETGTPVAANLVVWTGTSRVGTNTINGCCTAPLGIGGSSFGGVTGSNNVYATWVSHGDTDTEEHFVFAISSELTVPETVPEPGTIGMMACGIAVLGLALRRSL